MDSTALIEELALGSARGGRRPAAPLTLTIDRELTRDDIVGLAAAPPALASKPPALQRLKHSHHLLARLLAQGTPAVEASQITGYDQSRISILQADPAFKELLAYYSSQVEGQYVGVHAKLAAVGMDAADSLHEDLENGVLKPSEKLRLMELALDRSGAVVPPGRAAAPQGQGGGGVTLNVKFVQAPPAKANEPPANATVIDVLPSP